ncbi:FtsX-like permease family protein [Culicoidibacter larvae]|uniref:FtsX-like permease family protein n=1 Tax=Culicoidibacter larvae TaxID=2579976 RepID=A0A5R8QBN6_9FIRM|nr:FtsX-like permease family protein [Culicoidibacter larvae]TLG73922.1 FtsX-like permease family protein [Culicoidibacter larvae]
MIFHFLLKNLQSNMRNYIGYCCTIAFSVFIFYTFTAITHLSLDPTIDYLNYGYLQSVVSLSIFVLYIFTFVFIVYASSYFLRIRYPELLVYYSLGFEKHHLAIIFVIETLVINGLALLIGLIIGVVSTHFFTLLLYALIHVAPDVSMPIFFDYEAFQYTLTTFLIFMGLSILFTIIRIYMLNAKKVHQKMTIKKPLRGSFIMSFIAFGLFGFSYYLIFYPKDHFDVLLLIGFSVFWLVVPATFLFFSYFTGIFLRILKRTRLYLRNAKNFIAISSLQYQLRNFTLFLGVFTTLTTIALVMLIATTLFYQNIDQSVNADFPFAYIYTNPDNQNESRIIHNMLNNNGNNPLTNEDHYSFVLLDESQFHFNLNATNLNSLTNIQSITSLAVFSVSTYNDISNGADLNLSKTQAVYNTNPLLESKERPKPFTIDLGNTRVQTVPKGQNNFLNGYLANYGDSRSLIVSDELYNQLMAKYQSITFTTASYRDNSNLTNNYYELTNYLYDNDIPYDSILYTYTLYYNGGGTLILCSYGLAILIFLTLASILYFKLVADGRLKIDYFKNLYALGMDKSQIIGSIRMQFRLIFIVPCAVGVLHTILAIYLFSFLLQAALASLSFLDLYITTIGIIAGFILLFWLIYRQVLHSYTKRIFKNNRFLDY